MDIFADMYTLHAHPVKWIGLTIISCVHTQKTNIKEFIDLFTIVIIYLKYTAVTSILWHQGLLILTFCKCRIYQFWTNT